MARKLNAMIVEDSAMTRKMIMKDLNATGLAEFDFVEAEDGVEALEKFRPGELDLLFVDMQMPRKDGVTFLKELRGIHKTAPPSVMITSESAEAKVAAAIREARVDGFLLKPVDIDRLSRGLKKLIDSLPDRGGPSQVPHGQCVPDAMVEMMSQTSQLELREIGEDQGIRSGSIVFGGIAILGGVQWAVILGFQKDAAVQVAERFAGFEIPFDSPDMGDAISELTNIVAGHIKRKLVERGVDVEISLPVVNAAEGFKTLAQRNTTCDHRYFDSEVGKMWTAVTVGLNPGLLL
jgi:two-component system chemotaxis response regulator CheY